MKITICYLLKIACLSTLTSSVDIGWMNAHLVSTDMVLYKDSSQLKGSNEKQNAVCWRKESHLSTEHSSGI